MKTRATHLKTIITALAVCGLGSFAPLAGAAEYNLSADFSIAANPNGPWSYGWQSTLGGELTLYTSGRDFLAEDGTPLQMWEAALFELPGIGHNPGTTTAYSPNGQAVMPPGCTWTGTGLPGTERNFGVVRLTVPVGGAGYYRVETDALRIRDGDLQGDTEYHVVLNGVELYGSFLAPADTAAYTNVVLLAEGDNVDFAVGRGQGQEDISGLKIAARLTQVPPPPLTANAGPDVTVNEGDWVTLDGSAIGVTGLPTFRWTQVAGLPVRLTNATTPQVSFRAPPVRPGGTNLVFQLSVSDESGSNSVDRVVVHVENVNHPPNCQYARPSVRVLWPPNHQGVIEQILGVTDPDGDPVRINITRVTQDEDVLARGSGNTRPDAAIRGNYCYVRAERSGYANGRTYHIHFTATDNQGASSRGMVKAYVPHNIGRSVQDDGELYDSTR